MGKRAPDLLFLVALFGLFSCSSKSKVGPLHPAASCPVTIDDPTIGDAKHLDEGTPITYMSNPAAGGPHYPRWAKYGTHPSPIPQGYYVHDLEHGAIVLLYKCSDAACATNAIKFLEDVASKIPTDATCTPPTRVRVVIAPDSTIPTPFAAAAWGWTYTSDCADAATLTDFVKSHYRQGPEDLCADGSYPP